MEGTFVNHLNGQLFYETLARILSEQHGVKITVTVRPKNLLEDKAEKGGWYDHVEEVI